VAAALKPLPAAVTAAFGRIGTPSSERIPGIRRTNREKPVSITWLMPDRID